MIIARSLQGHSKSLQNLDKITKSLWQDDVRILRRSFQPVVGHLPAALLSLPCFFTGTVTAFRVILYGTVLLENKNMRTDIHFKNSTFEIQNFSGWRKLGSLKIRRREYGTLLDLTAATRPSTIRRFGRRKSAIASLIIS